MYALSLKEDRLGLPAAEYRVERKMTPDDEKGIRWVGVSIAVVGVTLMALSFALDGGPIKSCWIAALAGRLTSF